MMCQAGCWTDSLRKQKSIIIMLSLFLFSKKTEADKSQVNHITLYIEQELSTETGMKDHSEMFGMQNECRSVELQRDSGPGTCPVQTLQLCLRLGASEAGESHSYTFLSYCSLGKVLCIIHGPRLMELCTRPNPDWVCRQVCKPHF